MKVNLLDSNVREEDLIDKMYVAARTCYSGSDIEELYNSGKSTTIEKKMSLIDKVFESGHLSIAEHIEFSFGISGISRSCSHQLVRHRLCTFSQQSQRYVNFEGKSFDFVIPPDIANTFSSSPNLAKDYIKLMEQIKSFYDKAVEGGIKAEDARYILPNAACTNIVVSTNFRNLMHIMNLRLCSRAQWEIRAVFREMKREVDKKFPNLGKYLVPQCEVLGYCSEISCCGRKPKKDTFLNRD